MQGRPRRSVLYMPGSNERALEKAKTLPADALILDLEDAVAPDEKLKARAQVCAAVKGGGYGAREVVIRVNALETPWGTEDILAACDAEPDAILVPKVVHAGDIVSVAKILQGVHAPDKIRLWAMMETPMAILNARTIAATAVYAENRLCCLVMGTNDLIKESRARALHDRFAVVPWLAMTLVAARAYRLDIIDGVYNDFRDEKGLRDECERGRTLGMDGKTLIHPSQVGPCNEIFSPTQEEVDWARKVIDAFGHPENEKKGVIVVEGRMVERLHFAMAQRTVTIAEQIREMETALPEKPASPRLESEVTVATSTLKRCRPGSALSKPISLIGSSCRCMGGIPAGPDAGISAPRSLRLLSANSYIALPMPRPCNLGSTAFSPISPVFRRASMTVTMKPTTAPSSSTTCAFLSVPRRNLAQRLRVLLFPVLILQL